MSQLPETPAAGWSEQDYDPSVYGRRGGGPPARGAAPPPAARAPPAPPQYGQAQTGWQQDTEPDWGASQQGYPGPSDYGAQSGYAGQGQAGYAAQPGYGAGQAEQAMMMQDSGSGLPTEFDHLFRDSTPDSRRAIDRQKPMIGGAAPGYLQGAQQQQQQQSAEAAPAAENPGAEQLAAPQGAQYQQYPQQQGFPQAEQYENAQYQGAGYPNGQYQDPQYQAAQFQSGQYGQPTGYPQDQMGYGGPGGYDDGSGYGGPGGGGGLRNRKGLIIGGAVAVVAVIGIIVAVTSNGSSGNPQAGSGTPTAVASKASPKQQADQIYQLIQQSGQLRSDANTGVVDVNECKNLTDAQTLLSDTAQKRQAQADSVAKIDVTGIQNGTELVDQLKAAWTASAQYDSAYAQIAGDLQGNCKTSAVKKDPNYKTTNQQAAAADNAKAQAAQLWNANVAAPLGESQITEGRL